MTSTSTTSARPAAAAITSVILEVPDPDAAGAFCHAAFGLGGQKRAADLIERWSRQDGDEEREARPPTKSVL